MSQAQIDELLQAGEAAVAAGDTEAATVLADEMRRISESMQAIETAQVQQTLPQFIDKRRGAPGAVRESVGGGPDQDRLANIRRYYPDAQPYDDDNFIFTDPETGRKTLYNPPGFDIGDVSSAGREIAMTIGGGLGAVGGSLAGPVGTVGGAGAGTAAGGSLYDTVGQWTGKRIDSRGVVDVMRDSAIDGVGGAVGQRLGEVGEAVIKRGVGAVRDATVGRAPAELVNDAKGMGIDLTAGSATGSRMLGGMEKSLTTLSPRLEATYDASRTALRQAIDDTADRMGIRGTKQEAGERLKDAAKAAVQRIEDRQSTAYDAAYAAIGQSTPVPASATMDLQKSLMAQLSQAPESRAASLGPAIGTLKKLLDDSADGGIPMQAFRAVRTDLRRRLGRAPDLGGDQQEHLRAVYRAMTDDMNSTALSVGGEAARRLKVADRYTRIAMNTGGKVLNKILASETPERAFNFAMSGTKDGATNLRRLRAAFSPEEWGHVGASVLSQMGVPRSGNEFAVQTFHRNWNTLAPEVRQALFGGTRYKGIARDLDKINNVATAMARTDALSNTSNTGNAIIYNAMLSSLGGLTVATATGDTQSGAQIAVGSFVAPRIAARLLTSPRFVKWLANAPVESTNPNAMINYVGRLTGMMGANKADRDVIVPYLDVLREAVEVPENATQPQQ